MNREQQIADAFDRFKTDKLVHGYALLYAAVPEDIKTLLEIGVHKGGSLLAWQELFPQAEIYGLDATLSLLGENFPKTGQRIHLIEHDAMRFDPFSLPDFDLVIDDCTHEPQDILAVWNCFYPKTRGTYIIEDLCLDHFRQIWDAVISTNPELLVSFCRMSDHSGGAWIPGGDSHCLVAKHKI